MTFICNAGPVIALAKIDRLALLRELAGTVVIPETVLHEVLAKPGKDASRILHATREYLAIQNPPDDVDASVLDASRQLDAGEAAVIALASSTARPVTAILDDAAGRQVASRLEIPVLGFIGLLIIAKQKQLVTSVIPLVLQARSEGYWISDELIGIAAALARE